MEVPFSMVDPASRLFAPPDQGRFPRLHYELYGSGVPPTGCDGRPWQALDADATGDCVVASCGWQLQRVLEPAVLEAAGFGAGGGVRADCSSLRQAVRQHLSVPEVLGRRLSQPYDVGGAGVVLTVRDALLAAHAAWPSAASGTATAAAAEAVADAGGAMSEG